MKPMQSNVVMSSNNATLPGLTSSKALRGKFFANFKKLPKSTFETEKFAQIQSYELYLVNSGFVIRHKTNFFFDKKNSSDLYSEL